MDLHEDSQNNLVVATFELPGLAKESVQIDVDVVKHRLSISGEHNTSERKGDKEKGFSVRERRYGKSSRGLPLPHGGKVITSHPAPPTSY
jgi:HSP20 family protein